MNPADYARIGEADAHHSDGYFDFDWQRYAELTGQPEMAGRDYRDGDGIAWANVRHAGRLGGCDHCGQTRIRYWVFYLHVPSGEVVAVGQNCAALLSLDSREDIARRAQIERERTAAKLAEWRAADERNERAYSDLLAREDESGGSGGAGNDFVDSLLRYARRNGFLSDAQRDAVLRGIEAREQRAKERAERDREMGDPEPAPVVTGRIEVAGRLAAMKWQDSNYGGAMKMLVIDDRGFRAWGTCPDAIIAGVERLWQEEIDAGTWETSGGIGGAPVNGGTGAFVRERKIRVSFTATIERSKNDEAFGYFKRPTKAKVI